MPSTRALRHAGLALATLTLAGIAGVHAAQRAAVATTLEGTLDVRVEDFPDHTSRIRHFLKTSRGRFELKFDAVPHGLQSGSHVRVHGTQQGPVLALNGTNTGSLQALSASTSTTLGEQKTVVLLVNFEDDTSQPFTVAQANQTVFGDIDAYYRDNSFGQTWLSGLTYGWFTLAMSRTTCDADQLASLADQAAIGAGINLGAYARKVYVFPANACQWSGQGNLGGASTRVWSNGWLDTLVIGHELGHNLGLYHAKAMDCDTAPMGATCNTLEYGDAPDLMGNYRAGAFNAFEKERLGWLNDGISPPVITASGSGRYTIEPYSAPTLGAKAIKVPRGLDASGRQQWYYLEYREATGPDAVLSGTGNLVQGVIVRTGTTGDPASSRQLDMTPGSSTNTHTELADGALAAGRTYVDSLAGISITVASLGDGAIVDIDLGDAAPSCTRAAPALGLAGGSSAVAAGTTVTYTLSLTNRDSSACAATTFMLARSLPAGWTGTLGASGLSLSPGATGSTTLTVTSPASATAGSYGVGAGASSSAGSMHTVNASATYTIGVDLSESVATDKAAYARGNTVYMSALVKRDGVATSGASVVFTVTTPGGGTVTRSATSGADGYARGTYAIGKGKQAIGNYGVAARATLGGGSASATTTFVVR